MKPLEDVAGSLLRWCMRCTWDSLLLLCVRPGATTAETDQHFWQWTEEIERAVGTSEFRCARLLPRNQGEAPAGFFVLVGGVSSDDLSSWERRWSAITGDPRERGSAYSYRRNGKRVRSLLRSLLEARDCDIELRIGPRVIGRRGLQRRKTAARIGP
jgi:hypothetical protein